MERAEKLATSLLARGETLEAAGYHQQVKVTQSSVLLFILQQGVRTPIQRRVNGDTEEFVIGSDAGAERLWNSELLARITANPELFSPNVLLRPTYKTICCQR